MRYCKPTSERTVPTLTRPDGTLANTFEHKIGTLRQGFFPPQPICHDLPPLLTDDPQCVPLTDHEIQTLINDLPEKPGPGQVSAQIIRATSKVDLFRDRLSKLLIASVASGYHLLVWRTSNSVIIRKLNKPDYSAIMAHRPITLFNLMGKMLRSFKYVLCS